MIFVDKWVTIILRNRQMDDYVDMGFRSDLPFVGHTMTPYLGVHRQCVPRYIFMVDPDDLCLGTTSDLY